MQRAFGLSIPQTLDDIWDPIRLALVVYDMQVGIVKQIENGKHITDKVVQVLEAARQVLDRALRRCGRSACDRDGDTQWMALARDGTQTGND